VGIAPAGRRGRFKLVGARPTDDREIATRVLRCPGEVPWS